MASSKSLNTQWTLSAPSPGLVSLIRWPWGANRTGTSIRPTGRAPYWELSLSGIDSVTIRLQLTRLPPSRVGWPLHHSAPSLIHALPLLGRPVSVCHWSTCGLPTKTRRQSIWWPSSRCTNFTPHSARLQLRSKRKIEINSVFEL